MSRRTLMTIAVAVAVAAAGTVGGISWWQSRTPTGPECQVPSTLTSDNGVTVVAPLGLTAAQLQHASTINAVGLGREVPTRGRIIALATAWQESSMRNIDYGDRDSVGLFQQRPSQGWGEPGELLDPVFAATAFYDALERVSGWEKLPLTEAAQAVQRSGHPEAYAKWETDSAAIVGALSGEIPLEVTCRRGALASTATAPQRMSLNNSYDVSLPLADLLAAARAEFAPGDVIIFAAHDDTATLSLRLPDTPPQAAARALAAWMVAHATAFEVEMVVVGDQQWENHQWHGGDGEPDTVTVRLTAQ